ncbi:MAG TPA: hydantoinase B/oxoprolinase family protein [Patescibacteria group bacterium]|nr:hydantoinase B/oxoprolinase family protein [Patescibacteria group bacterium]
MRLDALTVEILRNYLQGAVEEMAYVVERTAYTTFVKETADFTCGLLNPQGEFFAYPIELGVASFGGISYAATLEAVGPPEPGDVVITNDPYGSAAAATHLPDIHLIKPIFWDGRLVAYGAGFLHSSDVGGMVPASISPRASEIFQEGLRVPPKKLFVRGQVNRDLLDVILANCRIPEQNWGDLQALVAGLTTGERRMHELIRRFGPDTVDKAMDDLIDYATRKVEALIRRMPAGRYEFSDYIEDDVVTDIPIRLKVAMTIGDGEIHLDFTGSDVQVGSALNVPTAGRVHPFMSVALVNYFATRDRTIPLNAGVLKRVRMTLPEGSVVNPKFPAACGVRYATVLRIYDAVLGALARAVPAHIPAASGGQGCMVALALPDPEAGRRHVTVIEPMIGGGGGRPGQDGIDGCDASLGFLKTTPAETLETEVPIVVRRYHLIPDSAGPGRFRGGFAVRLDFQVFRPEGLVTARGMERLRFAPWGVAGGTAGATGSVVLNPGTAGERGLPKIDVLALEPGDVLSVRTPGGGGHGHRFERPTADVATDVAAGLVSREHAREAYGVVLAGERVDETATTALRTARRDEPTYAEFDFGPARREHERRWPSSLQDAFIELLMSLPAPYRAYVRRTLHPRVAALADQRAVLPADLHRLWQELRGAIGLA